MMGLKPLKLFRLEVMGYGDVGRRVFEYNKVL